MPEQLVAICDRDLEQIPGGRYLGPTFVYVFQSGDKLAVLAQRFGTSIRTIQEINNLQDYRAITPGTRLLIPQR